jgi:menaquinone-dependent protoporphyrinogen oxidase
MRPIVIVYATREGQTRKVADYLANHLRPQGVAVQLFDAKGVDEPFQLAGYEAAIVAASIHAGKHEPEIVRFVKRHRDALDRIPSAFVSLSLSEVNAEDAARSAEDRVKAKKDVARMLEEFYAETGWRPGRALPVAGALLYRQYGFIMRYVMKQISKKAGGPTDTSRDYEFTDWAALEVFAEELVEGIQRGRAVDEAPRVARDQLPR